MTDIKIVDKQMTERVFDEVASRYNSMSYFAECGVRLVELLPVAAGSRILDIATGTGAVLLPAAERVGPAGRITGIDLSAVMVQQAKQAADEKGLRNVDVFKMDAEHLEFPDNSFDAVTCGFGIFFFLEMDGAIREMRRVLKSGGYLTLSVFDKNQTNPMNRPLNQILNELSVQYKSEIKYVRPGAFTVEEVEGLLTNHGFHSCRSCSEMRGYVCANAEDYWERQMSGGFRVTVMDMDEATRERFKSEYISRIRQLEQPGGFHITTGVVYTIAQK